MTVLLPTRRAGATLRDAFLRAGEGTPLLLPRLMPIGDIDADARAWRDRRDPAVAEALALPPAIAPQRRQILLARLVLARPDQDVGADQAMHLAAAPGRLIDEVQARGWASTGWPGWCRRSWPSIGRRRCASWRSSPTTGPACWPGWMR